MYDPDLTYSADVTSSVNRPVNVTADPVPTRDTVSALKYPSLSPFSATIDTSRTCNASFTSSLENEVIKSELAPSTSTEANLNNPADPSPAV
jgi:hypothetical protein